MRISPVYSLFLTARPKTLSAAVVPVLVATALARFDGVQVQAWISLCAVFSAIFIQIGTNFVNDALDFKKGADTETRLGDARATQSGWFSADRVLAMGFGFFCAGFAVRDSARLVGRVTDFGGRNFVAADGVRLHGRTISPSLRGTRGSVCCFVFWFGGGRRRLFFAERNLGLGAAIAGLQIGMLATVLIAINNLRDLDQDRLVGKKTFAVRVGPRWGRWEVVFLIVASFGLNFYWLHQGATFAALLPLLAIFPAVRVVWTVLNTQASREYNRLLAQAAFVHMLFGVMLSLGFLLK